MLDIVDVNLIVERSPVLEQLPLTITTNHKYECFRVALASLPELRILRSLGNSQPHAK